MVVNLVDLKNCFYSEQELKFAKTCYCSVSKNVIITKKIKLIKFGICGQIMIPKFELNNVIKQKFVTRISRKA